MTAPAPVVTPPAVVPSATDDDALGDGGKAALVAERKLRAAAEKATADALAKIAEFEAAGKSELEKANARAEKAEAAVAEAAVRELRATVAAEKGLAAEWVERLTGTTRAELEADADKLAKLVPPVTPPPVVPAVPPGTKPKVALTGGGSPTGDLALNGDPLVDALKAKLGMSSD